MRDLVTWLTLLAAGGFLAGFLPTVAAASLSRFLARRRAARRLEVILQRAEMEANVIRLHRKGF